MGAVLLIIVHIEGEAPSVFIDGVEAGAAIGVEPQIGIAVMAPPSPELSRAKVAEMVWFALTSVNV